ncbi:unnamed protein product [Danaus chrysippus]|uniref:(African queen) hypothetical protein n=1 Tax=Danaus chrysippus TaxID=151541 RepID=A0A8J2R4M7_9NEOP|nr:unnamed protein product [Danaus chrysippus]
MNVMRNIVRGMPLARGSFSSRREGALPPPPPFRKLFRVDDRASRPCRRRLALKSPKAHYREIPKERGVYA